MTDLSLKLLPALGFLLVVSTLSAQNGGTRLGLEIDASALLHRLAERKAIDRTLLEVLDSTRSHGEKGNEPTIVIFTRNFDRIARARGKKLASYYRVRIDGRFLKEEKLPGWLGVKLDSAVVRLLTIERKRLDDVGVPSATIRLKGDRHLIVDLPASSHNRGIETLLTSPGELSFRLVRNDTKSVELFRAIDRALGRDRQWTSHVATTRVQQPGADGQSDVSGSIWNESDIPGGDYSFYTTEQGVAAMQLLMRNPTVRKTIGADRNIYLSARPEFGSSVDGTGAIYGIYVTAGVADLDGGAVADAAATMDQYVKLPLITMSMNREGAERWAELTGRNLRKQIAIVIDGKVYSAPVIQSRISGGTTQITGVGDLTEAELVTRLLRTGSLPLPVKVVSVDVIGIKE